MLYLSVYPEEKFSERKFSFLTKLFGMKKLNLRPILKEKFENYFGMKEWATNSYASHSLDLKNESVSLVTISDTSFRLWVNEEKIDTFLSFLQNSFKGEKIYISFGSGYDVLSRNNKVISVKKNGIEYYEGILDSIPEVEVYVF